MNTTLKANGQPRVKCYQVAARWPGLTAGSLTTLPSGFHELRLQELPPPSQSLESGSVPDGCEYALREFQNSVPKPQPGLGCTVNLTQ